MGPVLLQRIKEFAEQAYVIAAPLDGGKYKGGYMCTILDGGRPEVFAVGQPDLHEKKWRGWKRNCRNKSDRLLANPTHISAHESSNLEAEHYFGGIRVRHCGVDLIIAFSGLSQELDEAVCAWIAVQLGSLNYAEWCRIRNLSGNAHMVDYGKIVQKIAA